MCDTVGTNIRAYFHPRTEPRIDSFPIESLYGKMKQWEVQWLVHGCVATELAIWSGFRGFQCPMEWHLLLEVFFRPHPPPFVLRKGDVFHNYLGIILKHNWLWWNCKICRNMLSRYQSISVYILVEQTLSIHWTWWVAHVINHIFPGLCNGSIIFFLINKENGWTYKKIQLEVSGALI